MRSARERHADALVRLYRPSWTNHDRETGRRVRSTSETWWADYREDGQRRRENLGTPFKADAELARGRILERLRRKAAGLVDPCADHAARPISEHVADYEATLNARDATPEHVTRTLGYLREGLAAMGTNRIGDLDLAAGSRWLAEVRARGFSARTVNVRVQSLRGFGRWLVESRRTAHNPFLGLRPLNVEADRRRVRRALTAEEAGLLLEAARMRPLRAAEAAAATEAAYREEHGRPSGRGRGAALRPEAVERLRALGERRRLVYLVALGTGLRRGEMGRIRWQDVDFDRGLLTIPAGSAKARREQCVPLASEVLLALQAERGSREAEERSALVFPRAVIPNVRTFTKDLREAGIEPRADDGTVLDFHALRVTLGTRLSDANVPLVQAQRILRHADPKLTACIYTKPSSTDLRAALDRAAVTGGDAPPLTAPCHESAREGPQLASRGRIDESTLSPTEADPNAKNQASGPGSGRAWSGGRKRTRTSDLVRVKHAL